MLGDGGAFFPPARHVVDALGLYEVFFIEHQNYRRGTAFEHFKNGIIVFQFFRQVVHEQHHIGVLYRTFHEAVHGFVHAVGGFFDVSGRIGEYNLEIVAREDANQSVPRGLWLVTDNAHALAHEGVHEGGFTHVGFADNIYKT